MSDIISKIWFRIQRRLDPHWKLKNGLITMPGSLLNLRQNGFSPATVLDVGAFVGDWTKMAAAVFPDATFHLFEAQSDKRDLLEPLAKSHRGKAFIGLLGASPNKEVQFYVQNTGSSVFPEATTFDRVRTFMEMRRIDDLVQDQALNEPILIKLDVQGAELEVLKGAPDLLRRTEVILAEVALLEYNEGAPLIADVIAFLAERDFVLYDVCGMDRRQTDLAAFQADMIFVRRTSQLRSKRKFFSAEKD